MKAYTNIVASFAVLALCIAGPLKASALASDAQTVLTQDEIVSVPDGGYADFKSFATINNGENETARVHVVSWRDIPFQTVKRQSYDYSCGSAAVATLLSYVYGDKTSEQDVFKAMFNHGDQDKIRKEGFSLLDMSNYLNRRGFKSVGYRSTLEKLVKLQAPFIALINNAGYNHFVIVKSVRGGAVLVGDSNKGNVIYPASDFVKMWNGIALIVVNQAHKAREAFANPKEWTYARATTQLRNSDLPPAINATSYEAPMNSQIAPTNIDVLSGVNSAVTSITSQVSAGTP